MGGRGSSSGFSVDKNGNLKAKYGSQYHMIMQSGNIKFVTKNARSSEPLMETMTPGRVYVTVGGEDLQRITYFDTQNKRVKTIDLDRYHRGMKPHTHHGYEHNEADGPKGASNLTPEEKTMVARVQALWYNHFGRR